jgi:hypothetical protein
MTLRQVKKLADTYGEVAIESSQGKTKLTVGEAR